MEETPLVSDWAQLTTTPNVVVVPFFISDGLHSYEDIPALLGISKTGPANDVSADSNAVFSQNPHHINGRSLFYTSAIGTDARFADIIVDQARQFDKKNLNLASLS